MPSLFSRSRATTTSPPKSQKPSIELSDEFGRISSRNSTRAVGTVPATAKKDRNVEKTRTRTLSAVKGRAPGPIHNEDEPVIPDGSFFPLNLDLPGADPANQSESEPSSYFIISLPLPLVLFTFSTVTLSRGAEPSGVISPYCVFSRSSKLCAGASVACRFVPPPSPPPQPQIRPRVLKSLTLDVGFLC